MKKLFLTSFAALMLVACGNSSKSADTSSEATQDSISVNYENANSDSAKATIEKLYTMYFNYDDYPELFEQEEPDYSGFGFMSKFVSEEFNKAVYYAAQKEIKTDDLWIDCDVWIDAQDYEGLELVNVEIKEFTGNKAVADVTFKNFGEEHTVGCCVIFDEEKEEWLIDDFILSGNSVKQTAKDFCSE